MGKAKAPAFQLYAGDFLTDVLDWTDEQVGAHIRLLCWSWVNRRGIPRDTQRLTRIAPGAVDAWSVIGDKWAEGPDDTWVNERLESTRASNDAFRASQRERSLLAVAARSGAKASNGQPNGQPIGTPMGDPLEDEEEVLSNRRKERAKVEIVWPLWAGPNTRAKWEAFKTYKAEQFKFKFKSTSTEQAAINLLGRFYKSGKECVDGLELAMAKGWKMPVDPSELAPKVVATPVENPNLKSYRV